MWVKVDELIKILTVVILEMDDDIIHSSKNNTELFESDSGMEWDESV